MAVTDRQRSELHRAAEESMGREPADSLMALLPPVGWADVATKHDLEELELRIDLRFESKLNAFRADLAHEMRGWFFAMVGSVAVLLALATAVARLGA